MSQTPPAQLWVDEDRFGPAATRMIDAQLQRRGITHAQVLEQMRSVPRHRFVSDDLQPRAYEDVALPTRNHQTISQPYIVALMCQLLDAQPHHRVLEIGTGSGYQTAILSRMARHVDSMERDADLADLSRAALNELGVTGVTIHEGDGTLGLSGHAPFDRITVTAGAPRVPRALTDQLADGGRLVIPVGGRDVQQLLTITRAGETLHEQRSINCRFVPLVGEQGW